MAKVIKRLTIQVVSSSQLANVASSLAAGEWSAPLSIPDMLIETPRTYPPGTPGLGPTASQDYPTEANDKQSWHWTSEIPYDPQKKRLHWICSPHIETNRPGSTLLQMWDTFTDSYTAFQDPLGGKTVGHGFDNNALAPAKRRLYKCALFASGDPMRDGRVYVIDIDRLTTSRATGEVGAAMVGSIPPPVTGDYIAPGMCFFPTYGSLGSLICFIRNQIRRWDFNAPTAWTTVASGLEPTTPGYANQIHSLAHYNPAGDYVICGGGAYDGAPAGFDKNGAVWLVSSTGVVTKPDECPFPISVSNALNVYKSIFLAHPTLPKDIIIQKTGEIWEFDKSRPSGSQWKFVAQVPAAVGSTFVGACLAEYGVLAIGMWLDFGQSHFRLYKPINPDLNGPAKVTGVTASTGQLKQVTLAWAATTDPTVAGEISSGLAGYNVYQDTALITPTPITPLTLVVTGLLDATSYAFQIAGVDNAGNEGAKSNIATGTTQTVVTGPRVVDWTGAFESGSIKGSANVVDGFNVRTLPKNQVGNEALFTSTGYTDSSSTNSGSPTTQGPFDTQIVSSINKGNQLITPRNGTKFLSTALYFAKDYSTIDPNNNGQDPRGNPRFWMYLQHAAHAFDFNQVIWLGASYFMPKNFEDELGVKDDRGHNMLLSVNATTTSTLLTHSYWVEGPQTESHWRDKIYDSETSILETGNENWIDLGPVRNDLGMWTDFVWQLCFNPNSGPGFKNYKTLGVLGAKDQSYPPNTGIMQIWKSEGQYLSQTPSTGPGFNRKMVLKHSRINVPVGLVPQAANLIDIQWRQYKGAWHNNPTTIVDTGPNGGEIWIGMDELRYGRGSKGTTYKDVSPDGLAPPP